MDKPLLSPYLRREERYAGMCRDVLFCAAALCIFSYVYFGLRPVLLTLTAMVTAVLCETLCCLAMRRTPTVTDGAALVTGALIGMLLPPIAPFYLPIAAAAFAILFVKMPFGGVGRNLFNPAAAGIAFATLCFSAELFTYPDMEATIPLGWQVADVLTEASPVSLLQAGGRTSYEWTTLLFGQFPGPIGATPILVLCGCGAYLMIRRSVSPLFVFSYLITCAVLAVCFPRTDVEWWRSMLLELSSGYLLFGGIFLFSDPVTSPGHWLGRLLYGVLAGGLVMLFRHVGRYEEGVCFAVLLCNTVSHALDVAGWRWMYRLRLRKEEAR